MTIQIQPLPTPPQPSDTPSEFNSNAFSLLGALPPFVEQANALGAAAEQSATDAAAAKAAALASQNAAKTSETNAASSKTAAASSQTAAKTSETNSKTSETNSKTSETNAKTSETNAKTSETNASTSAAAALASQNAAKTSETNADSSKTAAKTSETNAKTSETNAAASKTAAATSETNAASSKTAAAASQTAAKTSETNAAASATQAAQSAASVDTAYLRSRANHTGTQPVTSITGLETATKEQAKAALAMADTYTAVPSVFKAWMIVVTQPHLRLMVWNGTKYVRAPWHRPGDIHFALPNVTTWSGALPMRSDLVWNKTDYPDLADLMGVTGATFTLAEARGRVLRGLDNGIGLDPGRTWASLQEDAMREITGSTGTLYGNSDSRIGQSGLSTGALKANTSVATQIASNVLVGAGFQGITSISFKASDAGVPVASEFRMKNIAFNIFVDY